MKYIIILSVLLLSCSGNKKQHVDGDQNSKSSKLTDSVKIDTLRLQDLSRKINEQFYPNIHSVLIVKDGVLVFEKYFSGTDQNYGKEIGKVQHADTVLHDIRSITKSVVATLIGIAINQGIIENVDQKISVFFPEFEFEGDKENWTIRHFLTMTTGLKWNEKVPYNNPENDEIQMIYSKDPIQFVLNKPLETSPGSVFNYSGGATQILAEIVERASNTTIDQFAKEHLFAPLSIFQFEWNQYAVWGGTNKFVAPSGLRLTSQGLMKIGMLYRNKGLWEGKQLLNPSWVEDSFKPHIPSSVSKDDENYGYQFWMWSDVVLDKPIQIIAANGNGGQNIFWDLGNDLIVVTTAGNYNNWNIEQDPYALLKNHIYSAIGKEHLKNP